MAYTPTYNPDGTIYDPNKVANTTYAERMAFANWSTTAVRDIELRLQKEGANLQPGQYVAPTADELKILRTLQPGGYPQDYVWANLGDGFGATTKTDMARRFGDASVIGSPAYNEAEVAAGRLIKVPVGNSFSYIPKGSAAEANLPNIGTQNTAQSEPVVNRTLASPGQFATPAYRDAQGNVFDAQGNHLTMDQLEKGPNGNPIVNLTTLPIRNQPDTSAGQVSQDLAAFNQQMVQGTQQGQGGQVGGVDVSNLPPEYQGLLDQFEQVLAKLEATGNTINPNVEITPERLAEFTKIAESEIDPYYQTQSKLARESILRDFGYSRDQITLNEQDLEREYGKTFKNVGESAAERGFALSGGRRLEESELAQGTQRAIEKGRRELGFATGTAARQFAQQYGGLASLPQLSFQGAPQVRTGESGFQRTLGESPYYELSPDLYSNLIGTQEFARRGAIKSRTSQLEQAERMKLGIQQQRQLI